MCLSLIAGGRSSELCFVMAKALSFSPLLRYTVYFHSVQFQHFLYLMYIHIFSVVYATLRFFLPLLKFFIFFGIGI